MTLADFPLMRVGVIDSIGGDLTTRLQELGLAAGSQIIVLQRVAFGGPVIVDLHGFVFAMRRLDAGSVAVREDAP